MKTSALIVRGFTALLLIGASYGCGNDEDKTATDAQAMSASDAETSPTDAGDNPTDAGSAPADAGSAPADAGSAPADAEAAPADASTDPTDAQVNPPNDSATEPMADAATPDDTDAGTPPVDECYQATHMLDVAQAPGPSVGGLSPSLTAECDGDSFVVTTNGIPPYTYDHPRIELSEEANTWRIPRNPQLADSISYSSGPHGIDRIGFAVNGLQVFTPIEGRMPFEFQFGDPVSNGLTNNCGGHSAAQNLGYHYHRMHQECLGPDSINSATPWERDIDASQRSPIVGFAADGFPIYGPYGCTNADCAEVVEMQSGYRLVDGGTPVTCAYQDYEYVANADDPSVLDECNGHMGPDGTYHYHLTTTYPYHTFCLRGTPDASVTIQPGQNVAPSDDVCP